MNPAIITAWITAAITFLIANPLAAIGILAVILFLIDPMLLGFLIVGAIIWFAIKIGFPIK